MLTLRNVPDDLYAALKESAKRNRRSLNQEAIARLEEELETPRDQGRLDAAAERVREHRARRGTYVDHDLIDQFINEGRENREDVALERAIAGRKSLEGRVWALPEDVERFINEGRE